MGTQIGIMELFLCRSQNYSSGSSMTAAPLRFEGRGFLGAVT
jgi:hypothetical protein